jgi:hypothetical protein
MSALCAGLRLVAGALPWQAWAVVALLLGIGAYGCHEYRRGETAASVNQERKQQEAADAARKEVDRLRGGADRSRVRQFDRD